MPATTTLTDERAAVAERVIAAMAGPDARLRDDQAVAVGALCEDGSRVLVVQATGWGKSAVYWAATACRRAEGAGPTLVVSPLLSLMRDQVAAAARAGLSAATLNSSNVDEWSSIESALQAGDVDVLLVSPERLANPGFGRRVLDGLAGRLGLLVIDEAHAVSDWGHDFRPDYRRVSDVLQRLNPSTPVLATTATANQRVTDDVAQQLGEATLVLRGRLARASLELSVVPRLSPLERYAWVVDHLPRLPGSGIVYTLTVADAERLAAAVREVHGDDGAGRRLHRQARARPAARARGRAARQPAEGAGRDLGARHGLRQARPRLRGPRRCAALAGVVLPAGRPRRPRDRPRARGPAALRRRLGVWEYFATATIPVPEQVRSVLDVLDRSRDEPSSVPAIEAQSGVRRGRVELMLKQLAVDGVVDRVEGGWLGTGVEWSYDAEHYDGVVAVRRREADIMRAYVRGERCLMELLQESLDDPAAEPCGRCSVCRGGLPDALDGAASAETVATVTALLRGQVHILEPRKMWPGGAFGSRGKIPAEEAHDPGRTLVFADAPEWRETVAAMFARDAPAPAEVTDACVRVLAGWRSSWPARPEVVVDLTATGSPVLTASVADHLASVGGLERATLAGPVVAPDLREMSSSDEAAFWRDHLDAAPATAAVTGRTVLLVVDASSSLWPVTVASALLRRAGASVVLPLLLHRRP